MTVSSIPNNVNRNNNHNGHNNHNNHNGHHPHPRIVDSNRDVILPSDNIITQLNNAILTGIYNQDDPSLHLSIIRHISTLSLTIEIVLTSFYWN
jgi:hypothetical protein